MLERQLLEKFVGTRINSYFVDQLVEQSELGAFFLARDTLNGNQYVLCILSLSLAAETYPTTSSPRETFQHQANTIASLQHPYILPLVDYGSVGDMPYLAWPAVSTRPLSSRLAQNGALDILSVGRYLDQIAAALEYAHEHLVLHRNLSVDTLSLQLDGRLLVHDFGVRRMLEQGRKDSEWYALRNWNEACAPEQILGLSATPATDVYALGVILYQLLTGDAPYVGTQRKDVMQQHIQAPIPSLKLRRPDLPGELDDVIATAMAKQAADRFSQPGALANAYHAIVSPQQTSRVPFKLGASTLGTTLGNGASQEQMLHSPSRNGSLVNSSPAIRVVSDRPDTPAAGSRPTYPPVAGSRPTYPPVAGSRPTYPPIKPAPSTGSRVSPLRLMLVAGLLLVVVLGGFLALTRLQSPTLTPAGQVSFTDSSTALGQTNALSIQISQLAAPKSGFTYYAWLINQKSEQVHPLGVLSKHGSDTYSLTYPNATSGGGPGDNLLAFGNSLEITAEQGKVSLPSGSVVLEGVFPPLSFIHIGHLLVSYPTTPAQIGLLVGAQQQTVLLDSQAEALLKASNSQDITGIECDVQSILDIVQGSSGSQYRPISSTCSAQNEGPTGDGFGLLGKIDPTSNTESGFLPEASEHAALAATQPDSTANIRTHAHLVEVAIGNIEGWVATIEQDALLLQKTPLTQGIAQQILSLANQSWHGIDRNGNHQIDPISGEAGIATAFFEGQEMATLSLVPKS
jgi:serine/threonine protein kinase